MLPISDLDEAALRGLAAYHEDLLAGRPGNAEAPEGSLTAMQACLRRLEQDRRRSVANTLAEASEPVRGRSVGRFRLTRQLGQGSYGIVFLAHDPVLRREVALKVPRLEAFLAPSCGFDSCARPEPRPGWTTRTSCPFTRRVKRGACATSLRRIAPAPRWRYGSSSSQA